ncbi:MAG: AMIN domain-containing protein, partial [Gemmatimonadales bacterium]
MKLSVALATLGIGLGMPSPETGPGEVTGVSVLPASGRVVVVIDVRGSVTVQDFTLNSPSRVVIDVMGATLRVTQRHYDGRNRAGITNIRYSQFRPDVVRIVLELDRNPSYELEYVDEEIRISFGTDQQFAAWTTSAVPGVSQAVAASQPARQNAEPPRNNRRSTRRDPAPPVRPDLVGIQQSQVPRITATWDSARISEVVAGFAAFSGYSIVLGGGIGAEMVTAQIVDQPWDVALDVILDAHGLLATEDSANPGLLRVDSRQNMAARDTLEPLITDLIDIQFARAMSLAPSIDAITTERGIVVADTTSNSLIITDVRSRVEAAKSLVDRLDRPTQQVSIQAKIILVNRTDVEDLGVQYDLGNPDAFFNDLFQRDDPR